MVVLVTAFLIQSFMTGFSGADNKGIGPFGFLSDGVRECLSDDALARMNVAVNLNKPELSYYSISKLPSTLTWGPGNGTSLPSDDSRFMVEGKVRVRVLIIGEVSKCFLRGTSNNRGSCSLNVVPLYQAEVDRLDDLIRGFSTSSKGLCQPVSFRVCSHITLVKAMKPEEMSKAGVMISAAIGVVCLFACGGWFGV